MARDATDVGLTMQGVDGFEVLGPACVASFAASVDVFRGSLAEEEEHGSVGRVSDVRCRGAVAIFAAVFGNAALF